MDFFAKNQRKYGHDNSSYNESMVGTHILEYTIAMHKEINHIIKQSTLCIIPCNTIQKLPNERSTLLPGTWDFKLNRLLVGSSLKFKSRYRV